MSKVGLVGVLSLSEPDSIDDIVSALKLDDIDFECAVCEGCSKVEVEMVGGCRTKAFCWGLELDFLPMT
jgi:hypothetical protein